MSSAPFGGHPTLKQYLAWAINQGGCKLMTGYQNDPVHGPVGFTFLKAPNGRHLFIVDMQHDEYLVPTTIAYFDRRLGLQSPYFSIDPDQ